MKKTKQNINAILACILYIFCFWGITEASDFYAYTLMFKGDIESRDLAFDFLAKVFRENGFEFLDLYKFHIVLIASVFTIMIRRFEVNTLLVIALMILSNYVDMASQIRYFLAFSLAILSLSLFYVDKKYVLAGLTAMLAILFHKTVLILIGSFFLINYLKAKKAKTIIVIGILANLVLLFLFNASLLSVDEQYDSYFQAEHITTIAGAVFSLFPLILIVSMIVYVHNKIIRINPRLMNDKKYHFLYLLSITPLFLLLPSFFMQTIIRRFIITMLPIWLMYFLYVRRFYKTEYGAFYLNRYFLSTIMLRLIWVWVMPLTGIVVSHYYEKLYDLILNYHL